MSNLRQKWMNNLEPGRRLQRELACDIEKYVSALLCNIISERWFNPASYLHEVYIIE